jgi:hypothetical protein
MARIFPPALGLLCGLLSMSAFGAESKWVHVASADFEIFSSAGESDTRSVLQHFERVRSFFDSRVAPAAKQQEEPVRVIVFGSKKEYEQYRPNDFAAAFYTQIAGRDYIVLGGVSDSVFPTAVHEYVHRVAQRAGLSLPPWLNEGLAELYSTLKPVGDKVVLGGVIPGRLFEITQEKWVPLATILAATSDSPYYNEKNKVGSLYNEGWALTHMLELSLEYGPHFQELFRQILKGVPSQTAIESVYGKPIESVDKDLQAYLRSGRFTEKIFPVKLDGGAKAVIEPAQAFDVKLALLDLSYRPGKEAEIRPKISDLASEYPKRPEPQSALGYLDWRTGQTEQAVKEFASAFELGGRNPQMLWDYGRMASGSDPAGAAGALKALLAGQPGRVDVRLVLAGVQLSHHQPKDALETLAPVKSVSPADAPRLFELLAFARKENGEDTAARNDALQWLSNAKDADERERADRFIKSLDRPAVTAMRQPVAPAVPPGVPDGVPPRMARSGAPSATQEQNLPEPAPAPKLPSVRGSFEELDCSGTTPRLMVQTSGGRVALLLDQPDKILISGLNTGTIDMHCGRQKSAAVSVEYEPAAASKAGVMGSVRAIRFEP